MSTPEGSLPSVRPRRVAPLFPLPKVFLYPSVVLPLHVFEPRYRRMVEDLLDRQGWIVISPIRAGFEDQAAGAPPVYPVGGLGEIVKHTRLPDGRFLITLAGLMRVRIEEVPCETPYRQVAFEPLHEVQPDGEAAERLRAELRDAILERSEVFLELPPDLPAGPLSDLLLQNLDLPVDRMSAAFAEPVVQKRAEYALAEHRARR
ncbi:MAG: LON peptidase substrate-binding domain-containing protein [Planctomycetes bacterium]|nr:LON peptidase substrate-binding domain-containing protein [Planctomycetota bacterium]